MKRITDPTPTRKSLIYRLRLTVPPEREDLRSLVADKCGGEVAALGTDDTGALSLIVGRA